jgi:nicotinamide-nucleotide amidase
MAGELSPFLNDVLDQAITSGRYPNVCRLAEINEFIVSQAALYQEESGRNVVVHGMSGGVDSTLTAAVFAKAGYQVVGVTMPINQDPMEIQQRVEACQALGVEHQHIDLSDLYAR